jgi:hypothetical protein
MKSHLIALSVLWSLASIASCQFVWPKPGDHDGDVAVYQEDPMLTTYRVRFFAVLRGDFAGFDQVCAEMEAIIKKNPKDPIALSWRGSGQTIRGNLEYVKGHKELGLKLLADSRATLDKALSMRPDDPNLHIMRTAMLYTQGQYMPVKLLPKAVWLDIIEDCQWFLRFLGPEKFGRASTHLKGEAFGEMGVAYAKLGDKLMAQAMFEQVIRYCKGTAYEAKAQKEIAALIKP